MYTESDRRNDFNYYKANFEKLFLEYGYNYIAIRKGKIIGNDPDADKLKEKVSQKYRDGEYIMQQCSDDREVYRFHIAIPVDL